MTWSICRHWKVGKCNKKYCNFSHDGPGGCDYCPKWRKGICWFGENCDYIHGPDPSPPVDLKKMRCPTLDKEKKCDLKDACPYSHEEYMAEYFNRQCPAELFHGHVCTSRDTACRYRLHKAVVDKAKEEKVREEQQEAQAQAASPPKTIWRTNPVIVDGTCGRRPKPRNDNGPDKSKTGEDAAAGPSEVALSETAPVDAAPVEAVAINNISRGSAVGFVTPRARQPGMTDSKSDAGTDPDTTATDKSWADEVEDERRRRTPSRRETR